MLRSTKHVFVMSCIATLSLVVLIAHDSASSSQKEDVAVSFKKDVQPIIKSSCMPCHAEDNSNPSELSMDSYELLKSGGKHGSPFVAGKSQESILIQKLDEKPPFGDRMPLNSKRKIASGKAKWLSEEELKILCDWIDQGAKDN